jgi:hypothetical protein
MTDMNRFIFTDPAEGAVIAEIRPARYRGIPARKRPRSGGTDASGDDSE